jgi:hypothetical protein
MVGAKGRTFYFTKGNVALYGSRQHIMTMCNHRGNTKDIHKLHEGFGGGHFVVEIYTKKIFYVGY